MMFLLESSVEDRIYRLKNDNKWRLLKESYYPNKVLSYVTAKDKLFSVLEEIKNEEVSYLKDLELIIPRMYDVSDIELEPKVWRLTQPQIPQKQELESVLLEGDDNRDNVLILDLNGYFHLLSPKKSKNNYPIAVKYDTFCAKEENVGKNALENKRKLEKTYTQLLDGWLTHLLTGKLEIEEFGHLSRKEVVNELEKLRWPVNYNDKPNTQFRIGKSLSEN